MIGEKRADSIAELVADRGPRAGSLEVADVMGHETGPRAEDRQVQSALPHQSKLVALDRFAQLVVADAKLGCVRLPCRILDAFDLAVSPRFEGLRRGRVVAVNIDDHRVARAVGWVAGRVQRGLAGSVCASHPRFPAPLPA